MNYRKIFNRIAFIAWSTLAAIFFICSISPNKSEASLSFNPAVNYDVGYHPGHVAIGDLNGDLSLDLAVANWGDDNVSVLLGNGDGTFKTAVNYSAGDAPSAVAIGDLNGDGTPDLAVANHYSDNVSVLLGNGDGTFQTAVNYGADRRPTFVAISDLDGDSNLDLAVSVYWINNVSVLLGNGDGTFQTEVNYGAGYGSHSVAIGYLDEDGYQDLVFANLLNDNVSVLLGNGDGTFQTAVDYNAGDGSQSIAIGDLNGDTASDLAVANGLSDNVSVLLGNGDGTFQTAVNYATGSKPDWVTVGDLNGDGKLDLAAAIHDSNNVSVLLGNGDGTFRTPVNFGVGDLPYAVAIDDLNGDGKLDLATANWGDDNISILITQTGEQETSFSPSFADTSTWAVYKDTDIKDTKVITFADGGDPGERLKVVVRTTTGDRINYMFISKGSGYTGCDKSAYGGQWPGYRKIDLRPNSGSARLVKMKMARPSGAGPRQAYVGFLGRGDQGWDQTSGPADACGWLATFDSDDAFVLDEADDMLTLQTDLTDDGRTIVGQIEEPDLHVSYNVFSPRFDDTSTWVEYKDTNYKDTRVITFADAGAPGEKYKVVIKTNKGDTINYIFTSKGSGYTGCDRSAYDGEWPGYRKIVLGSNAGYAKLLKMKMIKTSGTGSRSAYVGFFGRGDKGWVQTSGPADGCGW